MQELFENPLAEKSRIGKVPDSCVLVIFGATGDLTARKLVPALYNLAREGQLPAHFACVGFARREKTHEQFRQEMREAVEQFSRVTPVDPELWESFGEQLYYHQSNFDSPEGYKALRQFMEELDLKHGTQGNRVYYLSTQPSFFPVIVENLHSQKLLYNTHSQKDKWSRVIIEKPFGHDLESALRLQNHIEKYLDESQVYRIDHYLGKETVQNLLVFRFANSIFESIWNNRHIDNVQITVSEDIGIGTRGAFFEEAGLLRDIVQNHMMQLLSLVAIEPPVNLSADAIRDEKVKVLECVRPIKLQNLDQFVVRAQYNQGFIKGKEVISYRQEANVNPSSTVETYVAMELYIDNWRWAGVPFYLRAGKRLPKRTTEIAITFEDVPGILFRADCAKQAPNVLVIRIQPDEGISLRVNSKVPGLSGGTHPVKMDFRYGSYFGSTPPEAYERLICDCMIGDSTLFARSDEVLTSWKLVSPVLEKWLNHPNEALSQYSAGTWGPREADSLLAKEGRAWRLI